MPRWQAADDYRRGRTCVIAIHAHLVFETKKRRHVLMGSDIDFLQDALDAVAQPYGATFSQMDGDDDHAHLLVPYPPHVSLRKLVNALKGASSTSLRKYRPEISKMYGIDTSLWSPSYFAASCGGVPLSINRQYGEDQRTPG